MLDEEIFEKSRALSTTIFFVQQANEHRESNSFLFNSFL